MEVSCLRMVLCKFSKPYLSEGRLWDRWSFDLNISKMVNGITIIFDDIVAGDFISQAYPKMS